MFDKREVQTVVVWEVVNPIDGFTMSHPCHAAFLQIHLMGVERSLYRGDILSDRFNQAVATEHMYDRMGLVVRFGMN